VTGSSSPANPRWVYEPLLAVQLQNASKRPWSPEIVANLNRHLQQFGRTPLDKFSPSEPDAKTTARVGALSKQIAAVDAAILKLRTARVLLPADTQNALMIRRSLGENIHHVLLAERHARERELQSLRKPKGPRPNFMLDDLIAIVADACNHVGVTVSAGRNRNNGKLDSPFFRVLCLAHARLPTDHQAKSEAALKRRARDTGIGWWKWFRFSAPIPKKRLRSKAR
jgi:hypothetical protein